MAEQSGRVAVLRQRKEKARNKIRQLLAPILGTNEIPRIRHPEDFMRGADPLWERTGISLLEGLLEGDASYRSLLEIEQLKTVSGFVVEKSSRLGWKPDQSAWAGLPFPATPQPPEIPSETPPHRLWDGFDESVSGRIVDYVGEFSSIIDSIQGAGMPSYGAGLAGHVPYSAGLTYTVCRPVEFYALLASSYISWLLYVHQQLDTKAVGHSAQPTESPRPCNARDSAKATVQISKRPPPFPAG